MNDLDIVKDIEYMELSLQQKDGHNAWSHAAYAAERRVTSKEQGEIAAMWFEYLYGTTLKINDKHGKKSRFA